MRELTINELEKLFQLIVKKMKDNNTNTIEITSDFYRFIPADVWDSYDDDIIANGSLFDDYDNLKLNLMDEERPFTYVDFDRLSSILNYISNKENPIG